MKFGVWISVCLLVLTVAPGVRAQCGSGKAGVPDCWTLWGNPPIAGANANILGATSVDGKALELRVLGQPYLKLVPAGEVQPNVIIGADHTVDPGVYGATISGGKDNFARGNFATVAGGTSNVAKGMYSFAAGQQAKANHAGAFVWNDSNPAPFQSSGDNTFSVRATGGVWFISSTKTNLIIPPGVHLPPGGSSWQVGSDRNSKENFAGVDGQALLTRLAAIPIQTWNWRAQDPTVRHIGPVGQDFYAAFGVGEDNKHISTVDADGVALAAVQALYRLTQKQEKKLREQQGQLKALKAELEDLKTKRNGKH